MYWPLSFILRVLGSLGVAYLAGLTSMKLKSNFYDKKIIYSNIIIVIFVISLGNNEFIIRRNNIFMLNNIGKGLFDSKNINEYTIETAVF